VTAPKLLVIETSCAVGTVALAIGDTVAERSIATPREQTDSVLGLVDSLLTEAGMALSDLDALVFGRGPGSFTGLRVAAAVTQGLSVAADTPIVSVSSLAGLAQRALTSAVPAPASIDRALCCVDARMGEVYFAAFDLADGLAVAAGDEVIAPPDSMLEWFAGSILAGRPFIAVGDGFAAYQDALAPVIAQANSCAADLMPRARDLLPLAVIEVRAGRLLPREAALPVYLRGGDAWRRS
jgi:tRNA threonylcarbamoyladenosine biosynthesis protein TsaB